MTNNGNAMTKPSRRSTRAGRVPGPVRTGPVIGNTGDLRAFLIEQMIAVANGQLEPQHGRAVAALAQQTYQTLKIELDYARIKSRYPEEEIVAVEF